MPIKITCSCGKKLSVKDEFAGRRMKCPDCGAPIQIPKAAAASAADDEWSDTESEEEASARLRSGNRRRGAQRGRSTGTKTSSSKRGLIIGLSAGGGLLVVVLLVWFFWPKRAEENVAANPASTPTTTTETPAESEPTARTDSAPNSAAPSEAVANATPEKVAASDAAATPTPTNAADLPPAVFSRSLKQLPEWVEADAPFKASEFWVKVPREQSGAQHYFAAFYEFTPHLMPPLSPVSKARGETIKARATRSFNLQVEWHDPGKPKNRAERDAVLDEHAIGFQMLFEAQKRPCVFEVGWDVPAQCRLLLTVREVARVAQLQVERDLERGDLDAAIRLTGAMLRLTRDLRVRAPLQLQLIADAVDAITVNSLLVPVLKAPNLKVRQCDELAKITSQHAQESNGSLLARLKGDYLQKRLIVHAAQHESGLFKKSNSASNKIGFILKTGAPHELLVALLNPERVIEKEFQFQSNANDDAMLTLLAKSLTAADFEAVGAVLKEQYRVQADAAEQPYAAQVAAFLAWRAKQRSEEVFKQWAAEAQAGITKDTPPAQAQEQTMALLEKKLSEPNAAKVPLFAVAWGSRFESQMGSEICATVKATRNRTWIAAAQMLVALRRWYATHDTPPTDIAAMCREAGIMSVPNDPYGNGPFKLVTFSTATPIEGRYQKLTVSAGETVIYSVGPDGVDDKALKNFGFEPFGPGDWLFRLEVPQSALPSSAAK